MRFRLLPFLSLLVCVGPLAAEPLPNTKPLTGDADLSMQMVAGIDKYLMRATAASVEQRKQFWKPDYSTPEKYSQSVQPNRERLKKIIGVVDQRLPPRMELVATTDVPALVAETERYKIFAVRWPVLEGVDGEGLLLEPKVKVIANVVAIPDADWTPEMLAGLAPGVAKESQYARRLAENGCRVVVPLLIDRRDDYPSNAKIGRKTNQPHREFVYRMAFEMGRHIIGYEVQKVLAAVDWFCKHKDHAPVCVFGYGEGGGIAFMTGVIDERVNTTVVCGCFAPREELWSEPIDRNLWGYLREFGDAELTAHFAHRKIYIEGHSYPQWTAPANAKGGAAPGRLVKPRSERVLAEIKRAMQLTDDVKGDIKGTYGIGDNVAPAGSWAVGRCLESIRELPEDSLKLLPEQPVADLRKNFDPAARQKRQFDQLVQHVQKLLRDSEAVREKFFWEKLDLSSPEKYEQSTEPLRKYLHEEVIGQLPAPTEPMNPKSREVYDEPKWKGYEVTLDLYPDVYAYGVLLVPKDLKPGEKRPVVVCQHGLEGRPQDVVNPKTKTRAYNSYGAALADLGYIVYAPQNPYIGKDAFRVLQRKANPLKLSLFSFIIRQHERSLDWLETLPFVDKEKIALYGLSYGGKTAMRVPAIEKRYCVSICSGDFNEWIAKNVSIDFKGSYMFTGEYEMFEFDLGNTFNYAEMAALIAPRPFMVERGHNDGVGIDEMVAYEFAKVRRHYSRLKLPERTEIEFFAGGHEIHGVGTYAFLKKQLQWPK